MKYYNITVNGVAYSVSVEELPLALLPLLLQLLPHPLLLRLLRCRCTQGCRRCCRCRCRQGSDARQHPGCQGQGR